MTRDANRALSAAYGFTSGLVLTLLLTMLFAEGQADAHTGCASVGTINGTAANDFLFGDSNNDPAHDHRDTINGLGGNDFINGYSCGDTLSGGDGNDELHGESGPDSLSGGPGSDDTTQGLYLGIGNDVAHGDGGNDYLTSNSNSSDTDSMFGDNADDFVVSNDTDGLDTANGGAGVADSCDSDAGDQKIGCEF